MNFIHEHKARSCRRMTLAARAACDHLWQDEYRRAAEDIIARAAAGETWCQVKVPQFCDSEMRQWYEWVLATGSWAGFERRPGGTAGTGYDVIFWEKPPPGVVVPERGSSGTTSASDWLDVDD